MEVQVLSPAPTYLLNKECTWDVRPVRLGGSWCPQGHESSSLSPGTKSREQEIVSLTHPTEIVESFLMSTNQPVEVLPTLTVPEAKARAKQTESIEVLVETEPAPATANRKKFLRIFREACTAKVFLTENNKKVATLLLFPNDISPAIHKIEYHCSRSIQDMQGMNERLARCVPFITPEGQGPRDLEPIVHRFCPHWPLIEERAFYREVLTTIEWELFLCRSSVRHLLLCIEVFQVPLQSEVTTMLKKKVKKDLEPIKSRLALLHKKFGLLPADEFSEGVL